MYAGRLSCSTAFDYPDRIVLTERSVSARIGSSSNAPATCATLNLLGLHARKLCLRDPRSRSREAWKSIGIALGSNAGIRSCGSLAFSDLLVFCFFVSACASQGQRPKSHSRNYPRAALGLFFLVIKQDQRWAFSKGRLAVKSTGKAVGHSLRLF